MAMTLGQWMTIVATMAGLTVYAFIDDYLAKRKSSRQ
jgi:hypothetical protein